MQTTTKVKNEQLMADTPSCRLQAHKPPFHDVGLDYFGSYLVKQGRSLCKRYECIFTCLTMRAVHIKVSHSLSTDSFRNALRRFISRRGTPSNICSNNGTNFVGANRILKEALQQFDQIRLKNYCSQLEINWHFNPPHASHMGGSWERIICSGKRILDALIKLQTLNDEGFLTLMTEVEGIFNSRPIVPIIFDFQGDEPLNPNHLLLTRGNATLSPGLFCDNECYSRKRWAQIQYLSNQFWKCSLKEFFLNLLQRQK